MTDGDDRHRVNLNRARQVAESRAKNGAQGGPSAAVLALQGPAIGSKASGEARFLPQQIRPKGVDSIVSTVGGLFCSEGSTMTPETKKSTLWTGGVMAVIIVAFLALWAAGIFPPAS